MRSDNLIFWLEEIRAQHNTIVGKKCANLGEMTQIGLPVPPGFAISINMYKSFLWETKAAGEISHYLKGLGPFNGEDIRLEEISKTIRTIIEEKPVPKNLINNINSFYEELCKRERTPNVPVAVRSAGIASRPGMFETYLNVRGVKQLLQRIKCVWGSIFTDRAISFRINEGLPVDSDTLGVAILKMINARTAGVTFTLNPINGDRSKITIEANWGLGESIVGGKVTPDLYMVDKVTMEVIKQSIGQKTIEYKIDQNTGKVICEDIAPDKQCVPCLSDAEVLELARLAKIIERHFGEPQDIEWAIDDNELLSPNVIILQTRPETVWSKGKKREPVFEPKASFLNIMVNELKKGH